MRYSLYIGRFQPFHEGHAWCIKQMLSGGKKVCVAVMDIHELEPENNPYSYEEVLDLYEQVGKNMWIKLKEKIERG